jgi:chromosome segregation ATPase
MSMTENRTTDAGHEDVEAEGRRAELYNRWPQPQSHGDVSDLPGRLANALADMRRQRDEAQADVNRYKEASNNWHEAFDRQYRITEDLSRQLTEARADADAKGKLAQMFQEESHHNAQRATEARAEVERVTRERDDYMYECNEFAQALKATKRERDEAMASRDSYLKHTQPTVLRRAEVAEAERDRYKAALERIIHAWGSLPKFWNHSEHVVFAWVNDHVRPAIEAASLPAPEERQPADKEPSDA